MHKTSRNILLIVIFTILLPLAGYILYSLGTLRENEKVIQDTYNDQLEAILFSVNQYSNDFMNSVINKMEQNFDSTAKEYFSNEILMLSQRNGFAIFSIIPLDNREKFYTVNISASDAIEDTLRFIVRENKQVIERLADYHQTGYRKLEPSRMIKSQDEMYQVLFTIFQMKDEKYLFVGLIEPLAFVEEVLRPRMQQIVEEQMIIALSSKEEQKILYATDSLNGQNLVDREMWLFPDLSVGITPKSSTINQLVRDRFTYHVIAIGLLGLLLLIGFSFLLRNVNREMILAQHKADFVSSVSHELRTPLALISMFAETLLLNRIKDENKKKEYHEIIYKETNRLSNIVSRILNFSKIEANRRIYSFEETDMSQLVRDVMKDYAFHLDQNGFTIHFRASDHPIWIKADRDGIYEGMVNLLDNAIKYSPDIKEIYVSLGENENTAWIEVSDKGIGIPDDKIHQIFDKFYRATERDLYKAKGAGLGLTILKHIMDAHNGKIEVSSEVGKGSTFRLIFNKTENTYGKDSDH